MNRNYRRIIIPKREVSFQEPLIFLAGPIEGAPMWQDQAIEYIINNSDEIYVASPSLILRQDFLDGAAMPETEFTFQLNWERFYLEKASENGCILFWLPVQVKPMLINTITDFQRSYARDTRGELGEWRGRMNSFSTNKVNIVIGGEENFDGIDVIKRNFLAVNSHAKFYSTLERTCDEAIRIALSTKDQ